MNELTVTEPNMPNLTAQAQAVTRSGLFGFKNENQALTLLLLAQSEGLSPISALKMYHIIGSKPVLKSAEVLSRFQNAGGKIKYIKSTDEECEIEFFHEQGGSLTIKWDIEKAKKAGIYNTNPVWQKYPSNMLRSRCITDGVVALYPVCLGGNTPQTIAEDTQKTQEEITVEAEIIQENQTQKDHTANKRELSKQLTALSFSKADVTAFAKMFDLGNDTELVEELITSKESLLAKIKLYEG